MKYVISNGEQYIRVNPKGRLAWTSNATLANTYDNFSQALYYLRTKKTQNFLKGSAERCRIVELTDGFVPIEKPENCEEDFTDIDNIISMDIEKLINTPHLPDENNPYTYYGEVKLDMDVEDVASVLSSASKILSNIQKKYESSKYLEKEMDLRILDIRHYLRDENTKLSGVAMQRCGYYLQELERYRELYKKNRLILELVKDDISKLKNENIQSEIQKIVNTPYRYRRISNNVLKDFCNGKYRKGEKRETKRVSKVARVGLQQAG